MNRLADMEDLQIPNVMARTATALRLKSDIGPVRGLALWRRNGGGEIVYSEPSHHTLSIYQSGGFGVWSSDTKSYGFSEAVCVLPEGLETRWSNSALVSNLHIYFTQADLEAMHWQKMPDMTPVIFGRDPFLKAMTAALLQQLDWDAPSDRLAIEHLVLSLLSRLGAGLGNRQMPAGVSAGILAKIEDRLHDLESGSPSLDSLSAETDLSPRHLTRVFKAATGKTVSERYREIQMTRAAELLATDRPLVDVALACGFSSQSHFTTACRRYFGRTPGQLRRQTQ
ncbi:helix-turn-helix transcriptional regulator [Hoeflea sp. TYP-13]|uniref:helix-turn-helix transcriptional regulator n=1 Tax=Hoeflea sp. TYP-13 TaxID=3230023 RepID=UPI0034C60DD9